VPEVRGEAGVVLLYEVGMNRDIARFLELLREFLAEGPVRAEPVQPTAPMVQPGQALVIRRAKPELEDWAGSRASLAGYDPGYERHEIAAVHGRTVILTSPAETPSAAAPPAG
jgi:hypothetical protein